MTVNPSVSLALDSSPYTGEPLVHRIIKNTTTGCLLYTSDAADDTSEV